MSVRDIVETDSGIGIEGHGDFGEGDGIRDGFGPVTTDEEGMFFLENLTITDVKTVGAPCWITFWWHL